MFGLLKWSFWICVALLFVPLPNQSENTRSVVLAQDLLQLSMAAASDMSGFCDRNPATCVSGEQTLAALATRVKLGAEQVYTYAVRVGSQSYEVATDTAQEPQAIQTKAVSPVILSPQSSPRLTTSQNTLLPSDLEPSWRGTSQLASN